jgi:DNA invertase Pin-like site-specific DNA recombinase
MRAVCYLRVSRDDQRSDLQTDELRELVKRRGWKLEHEFSDEGISGASDRRPGFRAMMEAARRRRFDVLVVWKGDRLYRSLSHFVYTLDELHALGIAYVSCTESFDSTTPMGKAMMQMAAVFAEYERANLRERTRAGLAAARRRGARLGRPRRHIDPELVVRLRAAGMPWAAIAGELEVSERTLFRALPKTYRENGSQPAETADPIS